METRNLIHSLIPLYLLHLAGGKLKGRTRLQKLVFLAQKKMHDEVDFEFVKGWYGPVSYKLMEVMRNLTDTGLINERTGETKAGFEVVEYQLTKAGQDFVDLALNKHMIPPRIRPRVQEAFKEYGELPFIKMLDKVHADYPEWVEEGN